MVIKLSIIRLLLLWVATSAPAAAQRLLVRTTFAGTNGLQECSAADMEIVQDACLNAIKGAEKVQRRQLRVRDRLGLAKQNKRQLQSRSECINLCLNFPRSHCIIIYPACAKFNWRRTQQARVLSCPETTDLVNDALDGIIETSAVSTDCIANLKSARTHECIPINEVNNGTPTTECPAAAKLDASGYCVLQNCQANFQCPPKSFRILDRTCYTSFDDCECEAGYYKSGTACVQSSTSSPCGPGKKLDPSGFCVSDTCGADFKCPINSIRKVGQDCYDTFDDCQCDQGFSPRPFQGVGYCVANDCPASANFACPAHSTRIPGQYCYDTFGDCQCDAGYFKSGQACILPGSACPAGSVLDGSGFCVSQDCSANFQCPARSSRIAGRTCYDNFDDCVCDSGYAKKGEVCESVSTICPAGQRLDGSNYCVEGWCMDNYQCPANSYRRDARSCYNNFEDCQCEVGFAKIGEQCVSNCPIGQKLDQSGYCVNSACNDNYICPINGVRKKARDCYNNFDDCDCAFGFKKQTNSGKDFCIAQWCYQNLTCPANSYRKPGQSCYDSFIDDCVCNPGFKKSGSQCVLI